MEGHGDGRSGRRSGGGPRPRRAGPPFRLCTHYLAVPARSAYQMLRTWCPVRGRWPEGPEGVGWANSPTFFPVSWRAPRGMGPRSPGRLPCGQGGGDTAPGGPASVLVFFCASLSNRTVVLHIPPHQKAHVHCGTPVRVRQVQSGRGIPHEPVPGPCIALLGPWALWPLPGSGGAGR